SSPYSVVEHGYLVRALQPASATAPAAVAVFAREVVERSYERSVDDPRVQHRLTLAVDAYGNATREVAISYPRRVPEYPEQARALATLEERDVLNRDDVPEWYRAGIPLARRQYELGPLPPLPAGGLYRVEHVEGWLADPALVEVPFEQ